MPLLWVLPLGVYLLSFTVAFAARRGAAKAITQIAPLVLLFACFATFMDQHWPSVAVCAVAILNLFAISVALLGLVSYTVSRDELQRTVGRMQTQAAEDLALFTERTVTAALETLTTDEATRAAMGATARVRASQLSWRACAQAVLAALEDAAR